MTMPRPDVSARTGEELHLRNSDEDFEFWKYHIGSENGQGKLLTEEMLIKWTKNPDRRVECAFCGVTWPRNYVYCPRCREYKGLRPYISTWSDWG